MVDVPFRPMDDHFVTILVFFAVFVGRRVPFFGHSLLSYSKRRHLSTSRVIPLIDCHQSLYFQHRTLSTFLPDLCFIWQSHRFQFLGCALPIGLSPSLIPATWGPKRATAERFWKTRSKIWQTEILYGFPNTLSKHFVKNRNLSAVVFDSHVLVCKQNRQCHMDASILFAVFIWSPLKLFKESLRSPNFKVL